MKKLLKFTWLYLPIAWFLLGFVVLPMLTTVQSGFRIGNQGYSFANYRSFIFSNFGLSIIGNTVLLGIATVILCGLIGTTLAILVNLVDFKGRKLYHSLLLIPFMLPGVLIVLSYIQLYGPSGILTSFLHNYLHWAVPSLSGMGGILVIHGFTQYIYFYTNISVALKYLDYAQIEAAQSLGASPGQIIKRILLPEIAPALCASTMMTFLSAISSFSAPNLIAGGVKVLSTQIMYSKTNNYLNIASMQVTLLVTLGVSILLLMSYYEKRWQFTNSVRAVAYNGWKIKNPFWGFCHRSVLNIFIFIILLPLLGTFYLSFIKSSSIMTDIFPTTFSWENYQAILDNPRIYEPFLNSISMALMAVSAGLFITLPIAYFSVKLPNKFTHGIEFIAMLAMAIPVSSIAINLINGFNQPNIFSWGQSLIGTFIILPIAYTIVAIPILLRLNITAVEKFNLDFINAAQSLGCQSITCIRKIIIPLLYPAIMQGSLLVFVRLVGEYNLSAFLYGVHNKPISIAMVNAVQEYHIGLSMAYGALTILISLVAITIAEKISEKIHF